MLVPIYQTIRRYNPELRNLNILRCDEIKYLAYKSQVWRVTSTVISSVLFVANVYITF
jgi:hypothetical protein